MAKIIFNVISTNRHMLVKNIFILTISILYYPV